MGINLVVAVTDDDWFEMLRRHPDLGEVNFLGQSIYIGMENAVREMLKSIEQGMRSVAT